MPRSAGIIQLQMEYRVSLGELLSSSLYLGNNLLGLEAFQGVPQLRDGERVEVDNRPHGAPSSGPDSRGRPGGREHARAHTHTRVACILEEVALSGGLQVVHL